MSDVLNDNFIVFSKKYSDTHKNNRPKCWRYNIIYPKLFWWKTHASSDKWKKRSSMRMKFRENYSPRTPGLYSFFEILELCLLYSYPHSVAFKKFFPIMFSQEISHSIWDNWSPYRWYKYSEKLRIAQSPVKSSHREKYSLSWNNSSNNREWLKKCWYKGKYVVPFSQCLYLEFYPFYNRKQYIWIKKWDNYKSKHKNYAREYKGMYNVFHGDDIIWRYHFCIQSIEKNIIFSSLFWFLDFFHTLCKIFIPYSHRMLHHILEKRFAFFAISIFFILFSLAMIFFWKLNLGIDMTWGTQQEFLYIEYVFDIEEVRKIATMVQGHINLQENIINAINVYKVSWENIFVVEAGFSRNYKESETEAWKIAFRDQLIDYYRELSDIELAKYTNIWASFWDYIRNTAIITLLIAVIAITVYIAFSFSWAVSGISSLSFAFITIITLFHDVIISTWLYILTSSFFPQFQFDTFFITALLTILGYSINDTIVVFDRIRSNLREFGGRGKTLFDIIHMSLEESITRSIYTSLTLVFVLLAIILFGPDSIKWFTLAMLFGTVVGTFSSLCIAAPLLYEFHKNTTLKVYIKREDLTEDDKMVV